MPRTFLVERIVDLSSSVKDSDTKFKVADDVTLDDVSCELTDEEQRCGDTLQTEQQEMMMSEQHRGAAMTTSDCRSRASVTLGKS